MLEDNEVRRIASELGGEHNAPTIRVGMHHGTAVERDGDWFGLAVNVAARVAALAAGGFKASRVNLTAETTTLVRRCPGLSGRQGLQRFPRLHRDYQGRLTARREVGSKVSRTPEFTRAFVAPAGFHPVIDI